MNDSEFAYFWIMVGVGVIVAAGMMVQCSG